MERFEVKHYTEDPHPTIKGNGFDGLVVGNYRKETERFISWLNAALEQGAQKPTTNIIKAEIASLIKLLHSDYQPSHCFTRDEVLAWLRQLPAV